jgi:hypothetical protein
MFLVLGLTQIRSTQTDNTTKANRRDETLLLMQDCVTPGGKCYERSQQQTAQVVGDISKANAIAAAAATSCAGEMPHQAFSVIYRCTVARVDAATRKLSK